MRVLVKFYWDCGRQGEVEGLFIANEGDLENLYGKEIHFGEILGKHSDVGGRIDKEDFEVMCDDQIVIDKLFKAFKGTTLSGYNPFAYLED